MVIKNVAARSPLVKNALFRWQYIPIKKKGRYCSIGKQANFVVPINVPIIGINMNLYGMNVAMREIKITPRFAFINACLLQGIERRVNYDIQHGKAQKKFRIPWDSP